MAAATTMLVFACSIMAGAARGAAPSEVDIRNRFEMSVGDFERELERRFQYPPPPPPAVVADDTRGRAIDAAYFERFPDLDRSYSLAARSRAKALAARLTREASALSHEQFVLRVAEIAALAGNAHTKVSEDALRKGTPRIALRTFWFADGLHAIRADDAHANLLGARIDTIEGRPVRSLFKSLGRYLAGSAARKRLELLPLLESPGLLHAAGLSRSPTELRISGILAGGQPFERTLIAEKRDRSAWVSNTARLLYPSASSKPMRAFHHPDSALPASLRRPTQLFYDEGLPSGGYYVGLTHNSDGDEEPLGPFLSVTLNRIRSERPTFVVVDMRMNGGGDYTRTFDFARTLPAAAAGARIYVLTSPWTFSAAITTIAALKTYGGKQVTIVGDEVGDALEFWAEGGSMTLPNSSITVHYASGRHDYRRGCTDRTTCFWLNEFYPVRVATLKPDVYAPWTFRAYREGRDPALEAVLAREAAAIAA